MPGGLAFRQPDPMIDSTPAQDPFFEHRRLLFATAYRMLGSVADAEDILQDAWLSWSRTNHASVQQPKAYLVRTVTNLSLNRLTSARATRESYVGPWLPEPVLTDTDVAERTDMAETVSMAMLVVMESLTPIERAVFVLREVFGYSHAELAEVLERPEPTIRQIAHRARSHVQARRPRFDTDRAQRDAITDRFLAACDGGDLNAMMELLAPDVTAWSDGGGKVTASRRPLHGTSAVGRWLLGVLAKPDSQGVTLSAVEINGELGVLAVVGDTPVGALSFDLVDGRMQNLRLQVNPDKLAGLNGDHTS